MPRVATANTMFYTVHILYFKPYELHHVPSACSRLISVTVAIHSLSLYDAACSPTQIAFLGLLSRWRHQDPSKPWQ
jgi:hypothetical protein